MRGQGNAEVKEVRRRETSEELQQKALKETLVKSRESTGDNRPESLVVTVH